MKAVIYARVSTPGQAEEELPIDSQLDRCRLKAAQLDAEVVEEFVDAGISGRRVDRKAFMQCIDYCETMSPDLLITWSSNRFMRNKLEAALAKRRLELAGVRLVYVTMDLDTSTDAGWFMDSMMEVWDEWQSRSTAVDTKRSMVRNATNGFWNGGVAPFGFQVVAAPTDPKRKALAPHLDEAATVSRAFHLRIKGLGSQQIADRLNEAGQLRRGERWRKSSVLAMLRSQAMVGRTVFNRKDSRTGRDRPPSQWIVVDSHQPIVSLEDWTAVQQAIDADAPVVKDDRPKGSARSGWAFTGLLVHGPCGSLMQIETAKGRDRRYSYYQCQRWRQYKDCAQSRIRADLVEPWLIDELVAQVFTPEFLTKICMEMQEVASSWTKRSQDRRRAIERQIRALRDRNKKLFEVMERFGRDTPNLADLTVRLREHNATIKALDAELSELARGRPAEPSIAAEEAEALATFLAETVRSSQNVNRLRSFLRSFVQKVVVDRETVKIEYSPATLLGSPVLMVPNEEGWLPGPSLLGTKVILLHVRDGFLGRRRAASGKGAA
jgi:site-specific DNA recombinase